MRTTIGSAWATYAARVVPHDAPDVQLQECRRAFYAGAQALFGLVMDAAEPDDEDDCQQNLVEIQAELEAFKVDVVAGRA